MFVMKALHFPSKNSQNESSSRLARPYELYVREKNTNVSYIPNKEKKKHQKIYRVFLNTL